VNFILSLLEKTTGMVYHPCGFLLFHMKRPLSLVLFLSVLFVTPLYAQKTDPAIDKLNTRLNALEKSIQTMQNDSIARNEKVASALSSIDQIKQDHQWLRIFTPRYRLA